MAEVLFILTTIFVAYVVYMVVGDQMAEIKAMSSKSGSKLAESARPIAAAKIQEIAEKPAAQTATTKQSPRPTAAPAAKPESSRPAAAAKSGLKDPATGEVVNIPNNYRFARRWIKEALVNEGLLDKVYKTNELDEKTNAKIKRALTKLAKIDQYKA